MESTTATTATATATMNIASGEWATHSCTAGGVTVISDCNSAASRGLSRVRSISAREAAMLRRHLDAAERKASFHAFQTLEAFENPMEYMD